jgi:rubrerythrin
MNNSARQNLIRILQNAYSGELAAAFAYRGHWKSLKESAEREQIKRIEAEEWTHRENVGRWLEELGAKPRRFREAIFWTIGKALGASCYISGWFFPMYFAGRLESGNVKEYEDAAAFAGELEMRECFDELMEMAKTEAEHEIFFRGVISKHRLLPLMKTIFRWS